MKLQVNITQKPIAAQGLPAGIENHMWTEFRMLIENILLKDKEPFSQVFISNYSYMNGPLAKVYGLTLADNAAFQKVSLQATPRRGILTTAAVLFSNSKEQGRSPMQRGKFLTLNLMCHRFPEAGIAQMLLPESTRSIPSLREKFHLLEAGPPCSNCHSMLGAGFAFDRFDPVGKEYTMQLVAESELVTKYKAPGRNALSFTGSVAAIEALAGTEDLPKCFTRRAFEFALGREAGIEDKVALESLYSSFKGSGYKVPVLLKAIAMSPEFLSGITLK